MIPKKVKIQKGFYEEYGQNILTKEELENYVPVDYIRMDILLEEIEKLQKASMGLAWKVLEQLKNNIKEI